MVFPAACPTSAALGSPPFLFFCFFLMQTYRFGPFTNICPLYAVINPLLQPRVKARGKEKCVCWEEGLTGSFWPLGCRPCPQEKADLLLLTAPRDKTAEVREANSLLYQLWVAWGNRKVWENTCVTLPYISFIISTDNTNRHIKSNIIFPHQAPITGQFDCLPQKTCGFSNYRQSKNQMCNLFSVAGNISSCIFAAHNCSSVFRWRGSGDFLVITKLLGKLELKMTLWRAL